MLAGQVLSAIGAAFLVSNHAATSQRLWLYPGIALAIAYIDSSIQGLCTESMVGSLSLPAPAACRHCKHGHEPRVHAAI